MSSSPEISTRTTGAHRAHREVRDGAAARTLARRPAARYEPYLDGLFTYCLSVLCDHDAATAALGDVLAFAERRGQRVPDAAGDRRAWLYALARWACLRKLTEAKQRRLSTHAAARNGTRGQPGTQPETAVAPAGPDEAQEQRRRELALLAWPEAAGTTPEQREALELAVRHHLAAHEIAAVLGKDLAAARELLASAACEVERTRAALAVVETGGCPGVARLTGENQVVLSAALRRELVRHVDDCPRCRRAAERAIPGRWPGAGVTPAELPVLEAPRAQLHVVMAHLPRARGAAVPRFDRRGFPMDPKDRAARRERLRARAVTTTVVATVVAAPVLALWAAYRGTPTGEGAEGRSASASEAHGPDGLDGEAAGGYENAGNASTRPGADFTKGDRPDVSVEVISVTGLGRSVPGHLSVKAANTGDTTLITLTVSPDGDGPVRWSATTAAPWLYLSRSTGTLRPGESVTLKVYVDPLREPSGHWHARVAVAPAGAVVSIEGYGTAPGPPPPGNGPGPGHSPDPGDPPPSSDPHPTPTPPTSPDPTPTDPPHSSAPTPTPGDPTPSTPETSSPPPTDSSTPPPSTP
ncbi:DNA-directed RNA polymerase specialized sigma subunit, sigma24 family [Streptomyces sp. yr375]|nr:DNA-directed RNA polymerase specialized sigma subunit, sigma24 family [Streptomyces sp. yr375]